MPDTYLVTIEPNPPVKPILPPARPMAAKPRPTQAFTTLLIVKDHQAPPPLATVEDLRESAVDLKTSTGEPGEGYPESNGVTGAAASTEKDSAKDNPEVYDHTEVMPEFPGGEEALKLFLQRNLRMPENSLESGSRVKVTARFVVGPDGKVRDIEILRSGDEVFNREVRRVILKMPDWKPGMQHNRHVAVHFILPVNFVAGELE